MSSRENYGWSKYINNRWENLNHNSYIYQTENGDQVLCTEVTSTPDYPTSKFDDFVFVGKLAKYVEQCYTEVQ